MSDKEPTAAEVAAKIMAEPVEGEAASPAPYSTTETVEWTLTHSAANFVRSVLTTHAAEALAHAHETASQPTSLLNPQTAQDAVLVDVYQTIGTQSDFLAGQLSELLSEDHVSGIHKPWPAEIHGQPRAGIAGPAESNRPNSAKKPS